MLILCISIYNIKPKSIYYLIWNIYSWIHIHIKIMSLAIERIKRFCAALCKTLLFPFLTFFKPVFIEEAINLWENFIGIACCCSMGLIHVLTCLMANLRHEGCVYIKNCIDWIISESTKNYYLLQYIFSNWFIIHH